MELDLGPELRAFRCCLGFTEAGHGSDLAGVGTHGEVVGDELVVSGTKTWVAGADRATTILVLCRTDPGAPRYEGLTCVAVPLHGPGVAVRPVREMTGAAGLFEVVLDRAPAPLANVVGGLGGGWRAAVTALAFARGGRAAYAHLECERELWDLVEAVRRGGRHRDPLVRQQLAWAYGRVRIMRVLGAKLLAQLAVKAEPGPEASLLTLFETEYRRRFGEIAVDLLGAGAMLRPGRWQDAFLASRGATIAAGTSEIQRDVVAERMLGLPGESDGATRHVEEVAGGPAGR
jgi:alkylation response protein AidB-like acyl-CoA dehydrogenase